MTCNVLQTIRKYRLLDGVETLCVGVSGGKDSVCLLDILVHLQPQFGYTLTVVHVNHGLRGENAARDEAFVEKLCKAYGVPCVTVHADVRSLAAQQGTGLEECGRKVRYQAFFSQNCDAVAVAHTLSDRIETSLFHLSRGTSLKGAAGFRAKHGRVIRPLIDCTRSDVDAYIQEHNLEFVSDETNDCDDFTRNYIRHHIVPAFQSRNASFEQDYSRFMQSAALQQDFLRQSALKLLGQAKTDDGYAAQPLRDAHPALLNEAVAVLLQNAMQKQTESRHVALCAEAVKAGRGQVNIGKDLFFCVSRDNIVLQPLPQADEPFCVPVSDNQARTPYGVYQLQEVDDSCQCKANLLDAEKLTGPLFLRSRQPGDRISLANRAGSKTLKKLLNEQKIPPERRNRLAVLTCGERIVWMEEIGVDRAFAPDDKTKQRILIQKKEDASMNMLDDIQEVFYSKEALNEIVVRLGRQISEDFKDKNLLIVSVLKGSVIFMADLMRNITIPCKIDFITASSYHQDTVSSGIVSVTDDLSVKDVHGYDILIVEDILDTGRTLQKLEQVFEQKGARSITICTLLDKPDRRDKSVNIQPKYIGAKVRDEFVVGYGLDFDQKYRNLPFIGILKPEKCPNQ